jgi:integrase
MAPIRAIKAEAASAPLPSWDDWRDMHLVVVENYSELSRAPWAEVRAIELFPGSRLDAEKFVIPEIWMAAGTLRNPSNRIFSPADAGIPADPELAAHRDECVRRALYALYLPGNGRTGIKANKPSTFRSRAGAFLRLAAWQFENRPSRDGSVFGDLTLADIVTGFYPAKAKTEKSRPAYTAMLNALVDAGERGVISDYPRFFAAGRGPAEEAGLEPVRRDATVLEPAAAASASRVEPFPDDFVTEFIKRALWIQENLADSLIDHVKRDMKVREDYLEQGIGVRKPVVGHTRREELAAGPWLDAAGAPLTRLKYPISQITDDNRAAPSTEWPPRDLKTLSLMMTILQGCNLGIVNLCTGARSSEILAADDEPFGPRSGRYQSVTFKLVEEFGGQPRDWPLHPCAERAIDKQRMVSELYRPKSEKQLWVTLAGESGSRLAHATSVFIRTVEYLGLSHLLGEGSAHMHRWRHTVARLVALSVVGAPKVLFDLFGHKDVDMTLHYMLSAPDIADEAMRVAKEMTFAMVENAVVETMEESTSGPAASSLRDNLPMAMRRSEDAYDTKSLRETAEVLTFDGAYWSLVREGVICTKGPLQYGPCTKRRGVPDPGACRTSCGHRLELAMSKSQCEEALAALIRERTGAVADGLEMLVANLDGQIVAELKRWDEVRDTVLAAHPEIRPVWEASSK